MRLDIYHHFHDKELLMSIADTINQIAADVAVLKAAPAPVVTVDLTPVTTPLAEVAADVATIKADLTPTA